MKRAWNTKKLIIAIALSVTLFGCLLAVGFIVRQAKASGTENGYLKFPGFNPSAPTGTSENPFLILEIVPYRGMGQIGYLIGGQEPVDISLSTYENPLWGPVDSVAKGAFEVIHKVKLESSDDPAEWRYRADLSCYEPSNLWKFKNKEVFKRQVLHISEDRLDSYQVRVVTITPEELGSNVAKFSKYYDLQDQGNYNKSLSQADENGEIDLIANADLISISPRAQAGPETIINLWENYGRDTSGKVKTADRYSRSFLEHDLDWQTTMELFMKVGVVENRAALIYDITCITAPPGTSLPSTGLVSTESANGFTNNIYKLCLMLRQSNPIEFYNLYLNTNGGEQAPRIITDSDSGRSTGAFPEPALSAASRLYWSEYTFLPFYPDGSKPAYIAQEAYKNYLNGRDFLVAWIAGSCHDCVIRNTYSYNGTSNIVQYFLESHSILDHTGTAYDYNTDLFDYLESSKGVRPADAIPLQAVEYLLRNQKYGVPVDRRLKILELEPCKDFSLTVSKVRQLLPGLVGILELEQQTTAEFIGRTEDLNSTYDLIYIGANTGTMNLDPYGKTRYNDPALDGLIYLHVGDRVVGYDNLKGSLMEAGSILKAAQYINFYSDTSTNRLNLLKGYLNREMFNSADLYRYSGNDITGLKRTALQEYVEAGLPVLLEKELYECNRNILDDSSQLYDFLNDNQGADNLYNTDHFLQTATYSAASNKLIRQLSTDPLSITVLSSPVAYQEADPSTRITDRTLRFEFTINAPAGSAADELYEWEVLVDQNADGRYTAQEIIDHGQAQAGTIIRSTKALSEKYADALPWKLKVNKAGELVLRDEISGFAAFTSVPLTAAEALRTQINVLQITADTATVNLEALMNPGAGKTSLFYRYTKDLEDFNVRIKTISVNEFLNLYVGAGQAYDINAPEETDKLIFTVNGEHKSYDMLILGFGDCYTDISNANGALDNIKAFIESGRSVLFTHDTTSFVNLPQNEYEPYRSGLSFWGYGINRYFRNRLGLDRFGIRKEAGDTTMYDRATKPSQARSIYKAGNLTNDGLTYPEVQGLTYSTLVAYGNPGSNGSYHPLADAIYNINKDYPPFSTAGNQIVKGTAVNQYKTKQVTKVNGGQITTYPYEIPDSFRIGESHAQYYQLNLDDPEIMVWFCLSDSSPDGTGPYSTSPNDTRNNYYIYSKGNVMYTVVGHSPIDAVLDEGAVIPYNGYEVKLFINTMIASYQAGVTAPDIRITNADAVLNSSGEYILYDNPDAPAGTEKKISFLVEDTNIAANQLVVRIYYNMEGRAPVLAELLVTCDEDGSPASVFREDGKENGYSVVPDRQYSFRLPLDALTAFRNQGKGCFYLTVTNEKYRLKRERKASLVARMLFDLD